MFLSHESKLEGSSRNHMAYIVIVINNGPKSQSSTAEFKIRETSSFETEHLQLQLSSFAEKSIPISHDINIYQAAVSVFILAI